MNKKNSRFIIIAILAALFVLLVSLDIGQMLTLDNLKDKQQEFSRYYHDHKALTLFIYISAYTLIAALSLPGAAVMTLAGGALFGLSAGVVAVSFASSIGATLAFLASRFLFQDVVKNRFGEKLDVVYEKTKKEGGFYLFTLRLVPVFPFFAINLLMGLTPINTRVFYLVSQVGMLPGTFVYVLAGTQLAAIHSVQDILSVKLMLSFALLGVFPLIAKWFVSYLNKKQIYSKWEKPKNFDYNMVVIGGGSAGLVASYIGAAVKAKVALIEKEKMGGDCLNTGCVPSKAIIRSAKMISNAHRSKEFGFESAHINVDFKSVMNRVHDIIKKIEPHDSKERYSKLGVDVMKGEARITSPYTVEVNGNVLTTRNIIVATGARPFVPPIKGLDQIQYLTSDNIWNLTELPKRLVVLGGGPIGSEITQTFARLGSRVSQVEMNDRIMKREDPDVSEMVRTKFIKEGVGVLTNHQAKEIRVENGQKILECESPSGPVKIPFDEILVAVGRVPNVSGFGLEELGVNLRPNGTIETNGLLQTNFPNIYCSGDVAGPYQFTHIAAHQSWYAAVNALFGRFRQFKVNYKVIPWATYTDPEVARVGLNIQEAIEQNIPHEVTDYGIEDLDRAITDSENHGLVRVLTKPGSDKILGVTIAGAHAGDLISEYVLAMTHNIGLNKILGTIHIYPTMAEANRYVAGNWKRAHAPEKLLTWVGRYHAWMRG